MPDPTWEGSIWGGRTSDGTLPKGMKNGWTDDVWVMDSVGPRNHAKIWVQIPIGKSNFGWQDMPGPARRHSVPRAVQNRLNRSRCHLHGCTRVHGPKKAFVKWGGHWCKLANTDEPSVCSGDAPCQMTTCYTNEYDYTFSKQTLWGIYKFRPLVEYDESDDEVDSSCR